MTTALQPASPLFTYKERSIDSPFVDVVWQSQDADDGFYLAAANTSWNLIFTTHQGMTKGFLRAPTSQATPVAYAKGSQNIGVRFRAGSILPGMRAADMIDTQTALAVSRRSFNLLGEQWELPNFENIESFLAKLARRNVLTNDNLVTAVLSGRRPPAADRTVQRHFLHTTGLTPRYIRTIQRANKAVVLLQSGMGILEVATTLGYADQAHMTRQVKHVSGCTPGEIVKKVQACRLRSIQGYGVCAQMKVQNFKGAFYGDKTI